MNDTNSRPNRRQFFSHSAVAAATLGALSESAIAQEGPLSDRPCFVSTWRFGKEANERSREVFGQTGSILDAVERGIHVTESDASNGSVGYNGVPNEDGIVQLDACIMYGPGHKAGSVAALAGFKHPISVARKVMEQTKHVMLAGEGARKFALASGFEEVDLLEDDRREEWKRWKAKNKEQEFQPVGHDTIALVGVDQNGNLAGGCSTSGLGYKMVGRVGDSPILGSGLYVDNEVGAAGATGVGENIMRFCGTFMVVEFMRQGMNPTDACEQTIRRISRLDGRPPSELHINFLALDKLGNHGAAGTDKGYQYAVTCSNSSNVLSTRHVT